MHGRSNLATRLVSTRAGRTLIATAAWTAIGAVFALPMMSAGAWRQPLLSSLAQWWSWALVTPLIFAVDGRLPFTGKQLARRVAAHGLASVAFTAIYLYVFTAARAAMGIIPWNEIQLSHMFSKGMAGWFLWSNLIYWVIAGALQAYRYYERYLSSELRLERLEKSYSQARLNALRMQLDPHFLFNALNTISSHVERDPKLTRRMIEHLGDLLRMSLESKDRQEVPLSEELAFLEHYLAIQKIRFGDQLKINLQIAPEVRYASVPSLFIQPLVENAIRHGISRRASGGTVTITAGPIGGCLAIRVLDDGVGLPPGWRLENSPGLGLSVTRERIAGLHPNGDSRFTVQPREGGGTAVEILLPLSMVGEDKTPYPVELEFGKVEPEKSNQEILG
jgi:two-component system LytT family sensor kinase